MTSNVGQRPIHHHQKLTHSSYKARLRGMTDTELAAERTRLQDLVADAGSGGGKDKDAVKRAKALLAEVGEEESARKGITGAADPAYAQSVHTMPQAQLEQELKTQQERLKDPAAADDAQAKLAPLKAEAAARKRDQRQDKFEPLPKDPKTKKFDKQAYAQKLSQMDPTQLDAEKARLEKVLADVQGGAHKDPVKAANAKAKLQLIAKQQQKQQSSTAPDYAAHLRGQSDQDLAAEKAAKQAVYDDATMGAHTNPTDAAAAKAQLDAIGREEQHRTEIAGSADPAYAGAAHQMDGPALDAERKRQQERLKEASSGAFRDPAIATDAQDKLIALGREQRWRDEEAALQPKVGTYGRHGSSFAAHPPKAKAKAKGGHKHDRAA